MEALLLAGGKAERLGDAAQGLPKPLVPVAGFPLAEYSVGRLIAAGVTRVIVACRSGQEEAFVNALTGLGAEIEAVGEEEPLGRGGGLKLAASKRRENGTVLALNGDELLDVDFPALLAEHERSQAAATIVVAQVRSPFGVVALEDDGRVTGFREAPLLDDWVNTGVYALSAEAVDRLPERGDHEQSTFPELAGEDKLRGFRHNGVWLTVNTPKDLRRAAEFMEEHPEWRPKRQSA
ncbi:MAG TPA: nucleotidyltransferase family protein [Gaiellaceae bacterium]|jgi:NDP-sugar pyrophosphorylase family protein|nr:nucleotidyltransferase family protein [Gaiellaceae bacterium]